MRRSHLLRFLLVTSCVGLWACDGGSASSGGAGGSGSSGSSSSSSSGAGGDGGASLHGACASTDEIGYFVVQHEFDYSVVSGEVFNGVLPSKILEKVGQEGDCILWRRNNPFCDPPCNPGETCGQNAMCVPYPLTQSVGDVAITGLAKPVLMSSPNYYDTMMPHPAFVPGAAIKLTAQGADLPGFTLYGQGFAPIELPSAIWTIKKGEPLTMSWKPDTSSELARIQVRLNIDQHGNTPVELICELKDTGSVMVPASLVDQLIGFGVTGFPSGNVTRHTVDSTTVGPGCVRFEVYSHALGVLEVADHIPCDAAHPCPAGKNCDLKTGTCL